MYALMPTTSAFRLVALMPSRLHATENGRPRPPQCRPTYFLDWIRRRGCLTRACLREKGGETGARLEYDFMRSNTPLPRSVCFVSWDHTTLLLKNTRVRGRLVAERSATTLCSTTLCAARPNVTGPEALLLSRVKEPRHERAAGAQANEAECGAPHLVRVRVRVKELG